MQHLYVCVYTHTHTHTHMYIYMYMYSMHYVHVYMCVHACVYSGLDRVSTPQLFYTHFYNHAHHLRLEKLLCLEPS
jgi:hypothetical protein